MVAPLSVAAAAPVATILPEPKAAPISPVKTALDKCQQLAQIIALLALPFIVAGGGWWIQTATSHESVSTQALSAREATNEKFVELALTILQKESKGENQGLRRWAGEVFAKFSPVPLAEKEREALIFGKATLPVLSQDESVKTVLRRINYFRAMSGVQGNIMRDSLKNDASPTPSPVPTP